jgi:hypothetical protein
MTAKAYHRWKWRHRFAEPLQLASLEKERDREGQADQEQECGDQFSWWSTHG